MKVNEIKQRIDTTFNVRDVQLVLLEMLKDIDSLCLKHRIPYWLTGGSALGAVRHQGFIPWDDDADIGMLRSDYENFLKVVHELGNNYVAQCFDFDDAYNVLIPAMKVRKKDTYCEENNRFLKNKVKNCDGLFIDIFIVDKVSEKTFVDIRWRILNVCLMPGIALLEWMNFNPKKLKRFFVNHAIRYGSICKDSAYVGYDLTWTFQSLWKPIRYRLDSVFPIQYVAFEDTMLPIPCDPKQMLDIEISPLHMQYPPKKEQVPKHLKRVKL